MAVNFDPIGGNLLTEGAVPAKAVRGLWTLAVEYVDAPHKLRFNVPATRTEKGAQAPNVWTYAHDKTCSADGAARAPINSANCLLASAPPGALIGKIGGSIAGKADGTLTFLIGSFCVYEFDDKAHGGPLYLAMNADPTGLLDATGFLSVEIDWST
jgi:hypothetical protein